MNKMAKIFWENFRNGIAMIIILYGILFFMSSRIPASTKEIMGIVLQSGIALSFSFLSYPMFVTIKSFKLNEENLVWKKKNLGCFICVGTTCFFLAGFFLTWSCSWKISLIAGIVGIIAMIVIAFYPFGSGDFKPNLPNYSGLAS